ncbi:MAG TPA: acyl-CoA dehydrogenase [Burkholderiales bacterium]|nr:acyl-CoA dehydrogenase [Burkholderiales bacterium]HYA46043.1 acyl-CoA dehydrogenase [Burkholderiales bacterium]
MSEYKAPLRDMHFVLNELAGLAEIARLPGCEEVNAELVDQILDESAKFATGVLSPLNRPADEEGSHWDKGRVTTPKGFKEAYRQFIEGGWNSLQAPAEYGGQGLPKIVSTPVVEMWKSANLSFSLVTMLTAGAAEALILRGSEAQKKQYLPRMIKGTWTGTMNLTEPQAGTDLALVRTKAVREGDHYRVSGQKIFITYGEHDLTENIVHLVLARVEGAPEGVKGISMLLVPKFLPNPDGSIGERNGVQCASIEHKLGIHASPTAVLVYENAVGYLVGEENRGLEYMFIMMNLARFAVGMEGLSISERAYQQALAYAKERVQSRDVSGGGKPVTIIHHPDVRRMLMSMKSQVEAMRALAYVVAAAVDRSLRHPDKAERARSQAFVDLMIPIVKGWFTETGIEIASTGIQVHGGMGFIEETGAAQHLRDARITTIYEGTTGIQANDLIGRKIAREGGATAKEVIKAMREVEAELGKAPGEDLAATREAFSAALTAAEECVSWMVITYGNDIRAAHAGAVPFLKLMGIVCGGWQLARSALVAQQRLSEGKGDKSFYEAKIKTARFYADHVLTQAPALRNTVVHGAAAVMALAEEQF